MGESGSGDYRARRRERERLRRGRVERAQNKQGRTEPGEAAADRHDRRRAPTTCAWCGGPITPRRRGPIAKWCSAGCRHRAWEQTRAAASGRAAVRVVEREVEIRVPAAPTRRDWARLLAELAHQLDDGRVYDRDLPQLAAALGRVLAACQRRPCVRENNIKGTLPYLRP